ncbi:MAG: serine hydroxymethyltransferase [Candidatus Methanomethylicia archaeon]|nr:serine hydroxymethyltransferase [Candidatus Methanomethylicia archaeon]
MDLLSVRDLESITEIVKEHTRWRGSCINLIASENVVSRSVKEMLISDLGNRYAIGFLHNRFYSGTKYIDELEGYTTELAKLAFRADHVNYVPISGTMANLVMFNAMTAPGDVVTALSVIDGGHASFKECSKIHGVSLVPLPYSMDQMNIDVGEAEKLIARVKPKLVLLGASEILFPHPVKEIRGIADEVGAIVTYDAAHVLGLIAGGTFQDPLREGAEVMTGSTHKTFFGPQGGIILCNGKHARAIDNAAWQLVNNHHIHRVAALSVALTEFIAFGHDYAKNVVKNAQRLAEELHNLGFDVLGAKYGFTKSHQVILKAPNNNGDAAAKRLEDANIITTKTPLPTDKTEEECSGIRLGTQEVTRIGMGENEMVEIARLIKRVLLDREDPLDVRADVKGIIANFREVKYAFNGGPAYEYLGLSSLSSNT